MQVSLRIELASLVVKPVGEFVPNHQANPAAKRSQKCAFDKKLRHDVAVSRS